MGQHRMGSSNYSSETPPPPDIWIRPDGHTEGDWENEALSYDEDVDPPITASTTTAPEDSQSPEIELLFSSPKNCDKVKFFVDDSEKTVDAFYLWLKHGDDWHVQEGNEPINLTLNDWTEYNFSAAHILQGIRFVFRNPGPLVTNVYLYDVKTHKKLT